MTLNISNNKEKYKIKAIQNIAIFIKKSKSYLLELYYMIL